MKQNNNQSLFLPKAVLVVIVLGMGIWYFSRDKKVSNPSASEASEEKSALSNSNSGDQITSEKKDAEPSAQPAKTAVAQRTANSEPPTIPQMNLGQFKERFKDESAKMGSLNHNPEREEIIIQQQTQEMNREQKDFLYEVASQPTVVGNERITAAYLVTQFPGEEGVRYMTNLANNPVPDLGPITPHSLNEIKRNHEIATRIMAIEELAKRAPTDPNSLQSLKNLAQSSPSPEVRRNAQRALRLLKNN